MSLIRMSKRTDAEGSLTLQVSTGCPKVECEILVVVPDTSPNSPSESRAWPVDYFKLSSSISDPTFVRPAQEFSPPPIELD